MASALPSSQPVECDPAISPLKLLATSPISPGNTSRPNSALSRNPGSSVLPSPHYSPPKRNTTRANPSLCQRCLSYLCLLANPMATWHGSLTWPQPAPAGVSPPPLLPPSGPPRAGLHSNLPKESCSCPSQKTHHTKQNKTCFQYSYRVPRPSLCQLPSDFNTHPQTVTMDRPP